MELLAAFSLKRTKTKYRFHFIIYLSEDLGIRTTGGQKRVVKINFQDNSQKIGLTISKKKKKKKIHVIQYNWL